MPISIDGAGIILGSDIGMKFVDEGTFSAASPVNVDDVFDAALFDDYRLILRASGSTNILCGFKMRAAGADSTSGYSDTRTAYWSNTGNITTETLGTDEWNMILCGSGQPCLTVMDISSPALAEATVAYGTIAGYYNTTGRLNCINSGIHTPATAYDGFSLTPDTGTLTGRWRLYGYTRGA